MSTPPTPPILPFFGSLFAAGPTVPSFGNPSDPTICWFARPHRFFYSILRQLPPILPFHLLIIPSVLPFFIRPANPSVFYQPDQSYHFSLHPANLSVFYQPRRSFRFLAHPIDLSVSSPTVPSFANLSAFPFHHLPNLRTVTGPSVICQTPAKFANPVSLSIFGPPLPILVRPILALPPFDVLIFAYPLLSFLPFHLPRTFYQPCHRFFEGRKKGTSVPTLRTTFDRFEQQNEW